MTERAVQRYCKPDAWKRFDKLLRKCQRLKERVAELEQRVELMELIREALKEENDEA